MAIWTLDLSNSTKYNCNNATVLLHTEIVKWLGSCNVSLFAPDASTLPKIGSNKTWRT